MCPAHSSASNLLETVYKQTRKVNKPAENRRKYHENFCLSGNLRTSGRQRLPQPPKYEKNTCHPVAKGFC